MYCTRSGDLEARDVKPHGIADRLIAFARENCVSCALDWRQLPGVERVRQHAISKLAPLTDHTANRVGEARRGYAIHDHGADGHESVSARAVQLKIHGADETGPLVGLIGLCGCLRDRALPTRRLPRASVEPWRGGNDNQSGLAPAVFAASSPSWRSAPSLKSPSFKT